MIPAAYTPAVTTGFSQRTHEDPRPTGGDEEGLCCCPNCGVEITATMASEQLLAQLQEQIYRKRQRLAELKEEVAQTKLSWSGVVNSKRKLAGVWNEVLKARSRVELTRRACDVEEKLAERELEEIQVLEKMNKRRSERLSKVKGKDLPLKERKLKAEIVEDEKLAVERLSELVVVRQRFINELHRRVFSIEVLPLSNADAGEEDYYEHTRIDCDRILDLDEGWVLGGVHCHPTPHIAIVAPSLPANGDHTTYLHTLVQRARNNGVVQEKALHPINDPYLSTPAALVYVAHFVELIGWVLDQPLPFPLHRPVAISDYGNPVKRKRSFLESMAKLDDDIIYLCFSQHVPLSALAPGHTLQNLLALVTHFQLGRSGPFECFPELTTYKGSLRSARPARDAPMSHDTDDNQPPNVSYTADTSAHSITESEEELEDLEESEGMSDDDITAGHKMEMDWEHLEPSTEETRLFEEEQMRLALSAKCPPFSPEGKQTLAHRHAQEVDNYRQRLRRLDYDSTYLDYAAHMAAGTSGSTDMRLLGSTGDGGDNPLKEEGVPSGVAPQQIAESAVAGQQQSVASGILGTLSSLWTSTSTFWSNKS